jgi:hypothetical protein
MVTELRIYFEGDGKLKPGFHEFLKEIRIAAQSDRCRFRLIDTNGTPVEDFRDALEQTQRHGMSFCLIWNVLLLDSDTPHTGSLADLCRRKRH